VINGLKKELREKLAELVAYNRQHDVDMQRPSICYKHETRTMTSFYLVLRKNVLL